MDSEQEKGKVALLLTYHAANDLKNSEALDRIARSGRVYFELLVPANYHAKMLQELQNANKGVLPPQEKLELADLHLRTILDLLKDAGQQGHQIEVYIEPAPSDKLNEDLENGCELFQLATRHIVSDLEKAIEIESRAADKRVECNVIRDMKMTDHIAQIYNQAPDKDLVVICGVAHKGLAERLNEKNILTEIIAEPAILSPLVEYLQKGGRRLNVTPEEKRKFMLKALFSEYLQVCTVTCAGESQAHLVNEAIDKVFKDVTEEDCYECSKYLRIRALRFAKLADRPPSLEELFQYLVNWFKDNTRLDLSRLKLPPDFPKV